MKARSLMSESLETTKPLLWAQSQMARSVA